MVINLIDTHAHINSKVLKDLKKEITDINKLSYLDKVINVGTDEDTNLESLAIASNCQKFYCALGIHPLSDGNVDSIFKLYSYSNNKERIVALGETGIDALGNVDIKEQTIKFIETIELANFLHLPIIIHANRANKLVLRVLKNHKPQYGFIFHCFEPNMEDLRSIVAQDGFISVGTPITRSTAKKSLEIVRNIPIDNLLIETDCPYMSTTPTKDGKSIFGRVKKLRELDKDELEHRLDSNAKRLFKNLNN